MEAWCIRHCLCVTGALINVNEDQNDGFATVQLFTPGSDHVAEVAQTIKGVTGADLVVRPACKIAFSVAWQS